VLAGRLVRRSAHLVQAAFVAQQARASGLDYLHAQFGFAPATIAWLAAGPRHRCRAAMRFGFTIHGFHDFVDPAESRLDLKARDAAHVLCISDFHPVPVVPCDRPQLWPRFHVAACGVDLSAFPTVSPPSSRECRPRWRWQAVGGERLRCADRALAQLKRQGAPQRLILVGTGRCVPRSRARRQRGHRRPVEFAGSSPSAEVRAHLERADLFCLSSFSEGLPISIMEGNGCGGAGGDHLDCWDPGACRSRRTALTVPPAPPDALAAAMKQPRRRCILRLRLVTGRAREG
jgi:hypothetical protein